MLSLLPCWQIHEITQIEIIWRVFLPSLPCLASFEYGYNYQCTSHLKHKRNMEIKQSKWESTVGLPCLPNPLHGFPHSAIKADQSHRYKFMCNNKPCIRDSSASQ